MKSFLRTAPHVILVATGALALAADGGAQEAEARPIEVEAPDPRRTLELAEARLEDAREPDARLAARILLAEALFGVQRFEEARECAALAVRSARASASPRLVDALTIHGAALLRTGPLQGAVDALEEAVPLTQTEARRVRALNALAASYSGLGEFDRAAATYERALAIADQAGLAKPGIRLRANVGALFNRLGRFESALDVFDDALERRAMLAGAPLPRYPILAGRARALQGLGRLEEALELLSVALQELRAAGDPRAEANALNDIGSLQLDLGRPLEAVGSLEAALALSEELKLERARAAILLNLSRARLAQEELEAAYEFARQSVSAAEASGALPGRIEALEAMAHSARLSGRHADAARHLERALSLERERRNAEQRNFIMLEGTLADQERGRRDELHRKDRELELERFRAERFQRDVFAIGLGALVLVCGIGWSVRSARRAARERVSELERRARDLRAERREREAELAALRQAVDELAGVLPRCVGCGRIRRPDGGWEVVTGLGNAPLHVHGDQELCPACWQRALEESPAPRA